MTTLADPLPPIEPEHVDVVGGKRPDITPAQIISFFPVLVGILAAFDIWEPNDEQAEALKFAILWGIALVFGDAGLRAARNYATARRDVAAIKGETDVELATLPPVSRPLR